MVGAGLLAAGLDPAFVLGGSLFLPDLVFDRIPHFLKRRRRAEMFIGETFAPMPRDPVTGLPVKKPPAPKQP